MNDTHFDDELFGELVEPQQASQQFHALIQQKNQEYQVRQQSKKQLQMFHGSNFNSIKNNMNKFEYDIENTFQHGKQKSIATTKMGSDYDSTKQHKFKKQGQLKLKVLKEQDTFSCKICQKKTQVEPCAFCKGNKIINGTSNMLKFMQYLTNFKLGLQTSYNPQSNNVKPKSAIRQSKPKKQEKEPYRFYSTIRSKPQQTYIKKSLRCSKDNIRDSLTYDQFKQELNNCQTRHQNYQCDKCQVTPIIGNRYHCDDSECENDYDLCEACFQRQNHRHQMKKIGMESKLERIKAYENIISKSIKSSCKKGGQIRNCVVPNSKKYEYFKPRNQQAPRIYISSIH